MATRPGSVSLSILEDRGAHVAATGCRTLFSLLEKSAFVIGEGGHVCTAPIRSRVVCLDIRGKCTHRYCAERESSRSLLLLLLLFASSTAECTELLLPNNRFLIPPTLLSVGSFFSPLFSSRFLSCYIVRLFFYASPPSPRTFVLLIFLPTFLLFNIRSFHRFLFTFAITRACQVWCVPCNRFHGAAIFCSIDRNCAGW